MMRTRMWPLLLFSFLLFAGCSKTELDVGELAVNGQYERLLEISKAQFSKDYQSSSLYYLALAQARTGRTEQAYHSLILYDYMTDPRLQSTASLQLMVETAMRMGDFQIAAERSQRLEKNNQLDSVTAQMYYQALLQLNQEQQAGRVFTTYLRHTIDEVTYAKLLIGSDAEIDIIKLALDDIDELSMVLSLLQLVSQRNNSQQRAMLLFEFAINYEKRFTDPIQLKQIYEVLSVLAQQADLRVQANKYRSLAQGT